MKSIELTSAISCPNCGQEHVEQMPEDSCQFFWECPSCGNIAKPQKGDCCVFCSYADIPCPPIQKSQIN
ncbi:GDCCVxC domain-containing (seleno)protein [Rhodohalobacter sp.]|uniref:GDCCVxC domain-containing (seleno)protein n=1 Tax=Rhodohalobacter sp. TaxID=1974210 RepID=UPI003565FF06